jgi:hypothetical protein
MRLFKHLDDALLRAETSKPKVSREAFIWPSSASATLYDQTESQYVGKCHRAEIFKMIGEPQTNPTNEVSARRFRMGRSCEEDVVKLAKDAGIFVAAGVRAFIPDINMTLELDLVVMDPDTNKAGVDNQAVIVENKSIYGYFGNKEVIAEGKPKKEAVMQEIVYLNEFRNGAILKEAIKRGLAKKARDGALVDRLAGQLEDERASNFPDADEIERLQTELAKALYDFNRNRIEVNEENLAKVDDGPLAGKLAYESRDECQAREFDIEIWQDPVTGKHYPMIDGEPYQWFDVEDLYARWRILKEHFSRMRDEAQRRMSARGLEAPGPDADVRTVDAYWAEVGIEMRKLPKEFLPPAEYDWKYADEKIERMREAGVMGKTKYDKWKKGARGFERLGSWQCSFCGWCQKCVPMEYPELAYLALQNPDVEAEQAA